MECTSEVSGHASILSSRYHTLELTQDVEAMPWELTKAFLSSQSSLYLSYSFPVVYSHHLSISFLGVDDRRQRIGKEMMVPSSHLWILPFRYIPVLAVGGQ